MWAQLKRIPNVMTSVRLLLLPLLWGLLLAGHLAAVGAGLILCALTDLLDGYLARRLGQTSAFGARFDSIADQLLTFSALAWVMIAMPVMFTDHWPVSVAVLSIYTASMLVGVVKFRQLGNLHLILSKVAGFSMYVFIVHAFLAGRYSPLLYFLAALLYGLASLETLLLQLMLDRVDEHMGSLLVVLRRRWAPGSPRQAARVARGE